VTTILDGRPAGGIPAATAEAAAKPSSPKTRTPEFVLTLACPERPGISDDDDLAILHDLEIVASSTGLVFIGSETSDSC